MGRIDIYPTTALQGPPSAQLGYAEVTASQGGITTITDLTGLAVTVTVPVGRRIKIIGRAAVNGSVASNTANVIIREGGTALQYGTVINSPTIGNGVSNQVEVVITPTAGTHTYKLSLEQAAGGGSVGMAAASIFPAFISVEDVTGTFWNGVPVTNPPVCIISRSTNQSTTSATITPVSFDTQQSNTNSMHSIGVNPTRITINTAGVYILTANVSWALNATGFRGLFIYRNGGSYLLADRIASEWRTPNNGDVTEMIVSRTYKFAAAEFIELVGYQTSGGALNLLNSGGFSPTLSAVWAGVG